MGKVSGGGADSPGTDSGGKRAEGVRLGSSKADGFTEEDKVGPRDGGVGGRVGCRGRGLGRERWWSR